MTNAWIPPEDPERMTDDCRYFASIPICDSPALELSIFVNRDYRTLLERRHDLIRDDRILLLCHSPRKRSASSPYVSVLSQHPLLLRAEAGDVTTDEDGEEIFDSHHKLGGRPFTIQGMPEDIEATRKAAKLGMRHFVQFDTPEFGENVSGSWPWGGGMFHVFFRGALCAAEWAAFWEI